MKKFYLLFLFIAIAVLVTSCKKDDNPVAPGGGSTSYIGTMANANESAALSFDIPTPKLSAEGDTVNISGKIFLSNGDTVVLSGIYIPETGYVSVSGGGYTITGTISAGNFSGTYSGPNGPGSCVATSSSSGNTVKVYCGTSAEDPPGTDTGRFNLVVDGTSITVLLGNGATLYGTLSGTTVTIYFAGTSGAVIATGVATETGYSGMYNNGEETGTWNAVPCQ